MDPLPIHHCVALVLAAATIVMGIRPRTSYYTHLLIRPARFSPPGWRTLWCQFLNHLTFFNFLGGMSMDDPIWSECDIPLTDIAPHDYDISLASSLDGTFTKPPFSFFLYCFSFCFWHYIFVLYFYVLCGTLPIQNMQK